jgi:hypothetical protein
MKKTIAMVSLAVGAAAASAAGSTDEFINFGLQRAHARGFRSCDRAIRDALKNAAGEDMRVTTDTMKGVDGEQLQFLAVYGKPGDTVMIDMNLRAKAGKCFAFIASTIHSEQSCEAWLGAQDFFKQTASTVGVITTANAGGVTATLTPVGDACAITYRKLNVF